MAVYQGERLVVARYFDIGELGAYSAAFMLTMVPCVLAAKVGLALLLPLFASAEPDRTSQRARYKAGFGNIFLCRTRLPSWILDCRRNDPRSRLR